MKTNSRPEIVVVTGTFTMLMLSFFSYNLLQSPLYKATMSTIPLVLHSILLSLGSLIVYEKLCKVGERRNSLVILVSILLGPLVFVGGAVFFVGMMMGMIGGMVLIVAVPLGEILGDPELSQFALQHLNEPYGPVLGILGVLGLALSLAPRDPNGI